MCFSGADAISTLPLAGIAHPSDVLDMPVDPNEPTYCLCHQVSYGEMIGCDNTDVRICFTLQNCVIITFFFSVPLSGSILRVWV